MKNPGISSRTAWKRLLTLALGALLGWWLYSSIRNGAEQDDLVAVDLSGKQHIGPDFNISEFFLNGTNGFNVGREGGGSDVCCVLLPRQWKPGLSVDLRWEVANWIESDKALKENRDVIPTFKHFRGKVPVEKYERAARVVVHFFEGGKARVVVGAPAHAELLHAVLPAHSNAADSATTGSQVDDMFTRKNLTQCDNVQTSTNKSMETGDESAPLLS
jgi:hypothetical protein